MRFLVMFVTAVCVLIPEPFKGSGYDIRVIMKSVIF